MQKNIRFGKKEPAITGFLYSFEKDYHGMKIYELFRSLILDELNGTQTEIGEIGNSFIGKLEIQSKIYRLTYNDNDAQIISWIENQDNLTLAIKSLLNSRIQIIEGNKIKFNISGLNTLRKYETNRKTTSQNAISAVKNDSANRKYVKKENTLNEAVKGHTEEIVEIKENNVEKSSIIVTENYEQENINKKSEPIVPDNPILSFYDSMAKGGFK